MRYRGLSLAILNLKALHNTEIGFNEEYKRLAEQCSRAGLCLSWLGHGSLYIVTVVSESFSSPEETI